MTESEKLDAINVRIKRIEIRQTIQLAFVVLTSVGVMAIIVDRVKKLIK